MQVTRRNLLVTAAPAVLLAGCGVTINPTTGQITLPSNVIDFIAQAVAIAAKYVPTVESIAATAASLFGPQFVSIVTIGSAAINTVIAYLTNLVAPPVVVPPASRRLMARLRTSGSALVGFTRNGIPVYGYPR